LGVVAAHSGTCLGLLLSPDEPNYYYQMQAVQNSLVRITKAVSIYHSFQVTQKEETYAAKKCS
jgi:uncharacterized protein involved in propanediol utilization